MNHPHIIIITGHSCSGKSTLRKELQKYLPGYYHIGFDSIKWNLSGYHRDRDIDTVKDILRGFFSALFERGIPCITDSFFRDEEEYTHMRDEAILHNYKVITIELRCPEGVRIGRFGERVVQAKAEWSTRISVTDEGIFRENMDKPMYFPSDSMIFDTSTESTEEITKMVLTELTK